MEKERNYNKNRKCTYTNNVVAYRKEHAMSQRELAERSGYSRQTIMNFENNRINPSLDLVATIADLFNVGIASIINFQEKKSLQ